jgi:hypothetical protein
MAVSKITALWTALIETLTVAQLDTIFSSLFLETIQFTLSHPIYLT